MLQLPWWLGGGQQCQTDVTEGGCDKARLMSRSYSNMDSRCINGQGTSVEAVTQDGLNLAVL
jgi:hypothetical protein